MFSCVIRLIPVDSSVDVTAILSRKKQNLFARLRRSAGTAKAIAVNCSTAAEEGREQSSHDKSTNSMERKQDSGPDAASSAPSHKAPDPPRGEDGDDGDDDDEESDNDEHHLDDRQHQPIAEFLYQLSKWRSFEQKAEERAIAIVSTWLFDVGLIDELLVNGGMTGYRNNFCSCLAPHPRFVQLSYSQTIIARL
jgi:hypothetical protein